MLSNDDIQRLTVSNENKLHALDVVLLKLDEANDFLFNAVYGYMPFSPDSDWQDEADKLFWGSAGMHEINDTACAILKARDFARHAVLVLKGTSEAKAAS